MGKSALLINIHPQSCVPYLPTIGQSKQKTPMFGDQGFFERGNQTYKCSSERFHHIFQGHNVSFSRSGEVELVERLDGLISVPQEWHKKKVRILKQTQQ